MTGSGLIVLAPWLVFAVMLADVEEALSRLSAGEYGRCEQCGAQIPDRLLATAPEIRYCPRCDGPYLAGAPSLIRPLAGRTVR
jgi:hypothetical protein